MSLCRFISLTEINKGWSGDKKYRAVDETGKVYLLRVTNSARGERYADMFRMQKKVESLGVSMCNPIECGKCEEGYYMLPSQTLKNNYGLTYLRAQVSEKGDAMITSVYRGNKAIEHKSVKLSAGDIFVECNAPLHKYNSKHLGVYSERLDFRYGQDGGIMDFILSATGEVKVELSGRSKIEYILRKSDAEAVEKVLELAQVLQNIESLQAMRAEASRHIEFIERNRERFEVEEKAAE